MSGDPEGKDDQDSALGFEDDEAADYQDRVDEAMKEARDRGDDTDELEDYFDRTESSPTSFSIGVGSPRDPIRGEIAPPFAPTQYPGADTQGGPPSVTEERIRGLDLKDGRLFDDQDSRTYSRRLAGAIGTTPFIDRERRLGTGALFGDPATDIFDSDLIEQSRQAAQAQGMTQYNPAQQQIQAARGPRAMTMAGVDDFTPDFLPSAMTGPREARSQVYNVAGPSAMTMQGVGAAGPSEPYLSEDVINEIKKQAQEPPREEGLGALLSPGGIIQNFVGDLTNRNAAFAREVTRPSNVFQRNDQGDITGVYNPKSNAVFTPESVGIFDFKGQEEAAGDLYKIQRQRQEEDRESRGGDDPIIPPLIPEDPLAQDQTPEPVVGQNVITGANYQPREPVQFAYTGLPTLAPVSLQPTFQAQQQFTPTFGLGGLRRS